MHRIVARMGIIAGLTLFLVNSSYALDSYRFLHVTIETPWTIFIFLLLTMFVPFILMAALVWRFAERKVDPEAKRSMQAKGKE